jgi:hypothetical protein
MKTHLALAVLVAITSTATANTIEVGIVQSVSEEHLVLKQTVGTAHIGFLAVPAALRSLKSIKTGQEVRAEFGAMTDGRSGAKISKLLSIRTCLAEDVQCAADRKRASENSTKQAPAPITVQEKSKQCLQAMQTTLANDPRYGPPLDPDTAKAALDKFDSFTDEERSCASQFASALREAYLNACEHHHCGENIGGGCADLALRAPQADFDAKAVKKCAN